jgi:hypothetical protein
MFEQEVRALLNSQHIPYVDGTKSVSDLDFFLPSQNVWFDAKEKTQRFSMKNWSGATPSQEDLFIIDDLSARKLLRKAPLSFCLIKDSSAQSTTYYIYSIVDLLCIPKTRVRRPIEKSVKAYKGKWLLDLRDAAVFIDLEDALRYMLTYEKKFYAIFGEHIDCWGHYPSEQIKTAGSLRISAFWKKDAKAHS